ncbi:peptide MFS transporter [Phenylobacterium sp.]|jgi:POT family proton-dependent oligopeptide transporter|uniref:peptide MFS transporter n=1 Tax=Phenylobacterium sp. TaxID=1871053 RepID=UPI002F93EFEB
MTAAATTADRNDTAFLGHPKALGYLAFTEAWERFSYYGMQTLLVLYMIHQLLLPGHVENVAGFTWLKALLDPVGLKSNQQIASAIFGWYAGLVYLTPILGGFIADRLLGRTRTIVTGALLMALGHFLMAFDVSFLIALLCLMLGSGCFKGNIATQVGHLYPETDNRRADAFQIFYLAINAGVIVTPLIVGTLGEKVGWHYGFGAAGLGMLVSIAIYLAGRKHLPPDPPLGANQRAADKAARPPMTGRDWKKLALLIVMLPVLTASIVGNQEIFNAYLVWVERSADLRLFGMPILTTWMVSVDSIVSVACLAGMVVFWRWWKTKFKEPDELGKIAIGCAFGAAGVLALVAGAAIAEATGTKVAFGWLFLFHLLNDIGFANVLPVGLALYARSSPRAIAGTVVGIYYLHLFAGNLLVGNVLGARLETMTGTAFWLMHAVLVGGACIAILVIKALFGRIFTGEEDTPSEEDVATADAVKAP